LLTGGRTLSCHRLSGLPDGHPQPDAAVLVDLAVNAPPDLPVSATAAEPTLAPEELAGHKLLALFDRLPGAAPPVSRRAGCSVSLGVSRRLSPRLSPGGSA
jgi:hypothetical protein